jgi:hypothetical protein
LPRNTKKIELGQVKVPLNQGLENGVPQQCERHLPHPD